MDLLDGFALLLVDDHPLFRDGLALALRHEVPNMRVQAVGTLADALQTLAAPHCGEDAFDLVLLDYRLPGADGLRCAELLMQRYPELGIGLISGQDDPTLPERVREAGLIAYLPKSLEISVLLQQLRRIAAGEPVFSRPGWLEHPTETQVQPLGLTARQWDVLRHLGTGGTNKEIARTIGISPATVKNHLEAIFAKLGASNRLQAVMLARTMLDDRPS